jgi:hypothetical protein
MFEFNLISEIVILEKMMVVNDGMDFLRAYELS